jgi:hypothetical protein
MSARFETFHLRTPRQAILPENQSLVVDHATGTITLADWTARMFIAVIDTLTDEQFSLLLLLLHAWSTFVPYEQALSEIGIILSDTDHAAFTTIRTHPLGTDSYNQARKRIDALLTTVREMLKTTRVALQTVGIDIGCVLDCGYTLTNYIAQP